MLRCGKYIAGRGVLGAENKLVYKVIDPAGALFMAAKLLINFSGELLRPCRPYGFLLYKLYKLYNFTNSFYVYL